MHGIGIAELKIHKSSRQADITLVRALEAPHSTLELTEALLKQAFHEFFGGQRYRFPRNRAAKTGILFGCFFPLLNRVQIRVDALGTSVPACTLVRLARQVPGAIPDVLQ